MGLGLNSRCCAGLHIYRQVCLQQRLSLCNRVCTACLHLPSLKSINIDIGSY